MHVMTKYGKSLREAEELANLLQQHRGTSSSRWIWERGGHSLAIYPRVPMSENPDDMVAIGEVLHLVRMALTDDGWEVRTTRFPGGAAIVSLEIVGQRSVDHHDELLLAILADPHERGVSGTAPADPHTAMILLHDAAVEHGAELTILASGEAASSGVEGSPESAPAWHTVAPRRRRFATIAAVVTTTEDTPETQIRAGEAAADIQLTAAASGLEAVPMSRAESRALVEQARLEDGHPQRVFRVGPPAATSEAAFAPAPRQPQSTRPLPRPRAGV